MARSAAARAPAPQIHGELAGEGDGGDEETLGARGHELVMEDETKAARFLDGPID